MSGSPELLFSGVSLDEAGTPVQINAEGLCYSIMIKGRKKTILHDICLRIAPGETVALMGASGAGKTTLLKVLAGDAGGISESSAVDDHLALRINGQSMYDNRLRFNKQTEAMKWYKGVSKLVPQDDILLPSLTGRQTLEYHAELTMPNNSTHFERSAQVEKVLKMMNLMKCADTCVGSVEKRGMSGGERKRLSMGIELLSNPKVLLLDEPTTGLDSKNAEDVCRVMSILAQSGLAVVCSIHQPSYRVLKTFDRLVLLHDGRLVFNGRVDAMESYFESLGVVVPQHENPMDHFVKVVQESDARRKEILKRRIQRAEERQRIQENLQINTNVKNGNVAPIDRLVSPLLMNNSHESGAATPMNISSDEAHKTEQAMLNMAMDFEATSNDVDDLLSIADDELPLDFAEEWKKVEALVMNARDRVHCSTKETLSFASIIENPPSQRHIASTRTRRGVSYSQRFGGQAAGTGMHASASSLNGSNRNLNSSAAVVTSVSSSSSAVNQNAAAAMMTQMRRASVGTVSTAALTADIPSMHNSYNMEKNAQEKLRTLAQVTADHPAFQTSSPLGLINKQESHLLAADFACLVPDPQTFTLARVTGGDVAREEEELLAETVLGGYWQKLAPPMPSKEEMKLHSEAHTISIPQQTWLLFKRTMYDQLHDRKKFLGACIMKLSLGLLAGFCWLNQGRPPVNQAIFPLTGVLYTMSNNCVMANLFQTILSLPTERSLAQREHRNGAYSLVAYYLSTIFASILIQTFQCILLGVPPYFMVGLQPEASKVVIFILTLSVLSSIGCALGLMVGAVASDYKSAQQAMLPILVPLTLFSGYVIPYDSIPSMFQPFYYASFFQYAFGILRLNQFSGLKFDDCDPFIPEPYNYCTGEAYLKSETANLDPAHNDIPSKMLILLGELALIGVVGFGLLKYKFSQKTC